MWVDDPLDPPVFSSKSAKRFVNTFILLPILISEIVYIGNIHPFHCETTKLMLNSGKRVLCEKPLAMNYKEVKEMIDLAKEKDLFLAEVCKIQCFDPRCNILIRFNFFCHRQAL